jgi:hypothetical protein
MSLIDDALRRAREEAALRDAAGRPGASRWAPSHIPGRRRSAWKPAAALVAVFLAGSAAAWLLVGRSRVAPVPAPAASPSEPAPLSNLPAAPLANRTAAAAPALPEKPEPPARNGIRPEAVSRRPAAKSFPAHEPAPPAPAPSAAAPNAASPSTPARSTFVRTATLAGGETIELGGIVYSEGNPVALINGKVVAPGGLVGDYTVVQIRPERVDFSGNGASFSILLR